MEDKYTAIQYLNKTEGYPIKKLCSKAGASRSGYYKWLKRVPSEHQKINEQLAEWIKNLTERNIGISSDDNNSQPQVQSPLQQETHIQTHADITPEVCMQKEKIQLY